MTEAIGSSSFHPEELTELLFKAVEQATFHSPGEEGIQSYQLKALYHRSIDREKSTVVAAVTPQVNEELLLAVVKQLRFLLSPYIEDDRIGNGFVMGQGNLAESTVTDFARQCLRASAILGSHEVVNLIREWASGQPAQYRKCALLFGFTIDQPLEMEDLGESFGDVHFEPLSMSKADLLTTLPNASRLYLDDLRLTNAVKATIDHAGDSAFYRPEKQILPLEVTEFPEITRDSKWEALCEALSLALNGDVSWGLAWADYDEIRAFGLLGLSLTSGGSTESDNSLNGPLMRPEALATVHEILMRRLKRSRPKDGLNLAIRRWMRSIKYSSIADSFIELRIALESLYLKGINGELGFRLATNGAWHLGADFEDRHRYQETLHKAYSLASKAVHAGEVRNTIVNREVLRSAQDLCRKGILKRLYEPREPEWNELILGKEIEAEP